MEQVTLSKEQFDELMKSQEALKGKLQQDADAIRKAELDKIVADAIEKIRPSVTPPAPKKIIFTGEPKENEIRMSFQKFLIAVRDKNPDVLKTVMEVQTDAQGGYAVPTEYATEILGALNNIATVPGKCTQITQGAPTLRYPSWLTDLTIYWVDEDATKTLTKPTLSYKNLVLKKMACIVPFTDELLDDNNCDLQGKVTGLVGENMGLAVEQQVLEGNANPFTGIANVAGVNAVAQAGVALAYDDLVDVVTNTGLLGRYLIGAEWWINLTQLGIIMKLKDNQNRPLWNMGIAPAVPGTILGYPYNISDQITVGGGTSTIMFGNMKYVILGNPKKNAGVKVDVSNSATTPAAGTTTQNAFMQDETWYRFVKRQGILVAVPAAFVRLTGVK